MNAAPEWLVPDWPAPAAIAAACSTRIGGVSRGPWAGLNLGLGSGDDSAAVGENRRRLSAALQLPGEPQWLRQVHGIEVVEAPLRQALPAADGCWSRQPGCVCVVQAADCLPVLFCDRAGSVVAAAHAGWRGLSAGVLEATVHALPVAPDRLLAWLGPAIGPEAFEVGDEVRTAFLRHDAGAGRAFRPAGGTGQWFADLFALARRRLAAAGVSAVYGGGLSTHADPVRYYSYRRDGTCGRLAALIWRR